MVRPVTPRTVLEQCIRQRRQTFEEFAESLEMFAREHREPGTLGVRHLQRLCAGRQPSHLVRATTARLLERVLDMPLERLLSSPDSENAESDTARSQREWLYVRRSQYARGRELSELAAWLYPQTQRAPGGHVLQGPGWLLHKPVELDAVQLAWAPDTPPPAELVTMHHVLPLKEPWQRYPDYSHAVRDLARPKLLENRVSYRLADMCWNGRTLSLAFGTTTFFEAFNIRQSVAHEFKAAWHQAGRSMPTWDDLPLRREIGDPFDPGRLLMSPGISTLTIRRSRSGAHRFVLHERDGTKVADGNNLCHVMPAGEFQPSTIAPDEARNDLSLWRNIMREYSEEYLGNPEHDGNGPAINYTTDRPFCDFQAARQAGALRLWHYGLIVEPLELAPGQLTVAVIDDDTYDQLFQSITRTNDEGNVLGMDGRADVPFTDDAINRLQPRLTGTALTLLRMAWRDRELLLDA